MVKTPETAKVFFHGLKEMNKLNALHLKNNNLGELFTIPKTAEVIFEGLGKVRQLKSIFLTECNLSELLENPKTAKVFFEGLGKLRQLKILSFAESKLGELIENPKTAKVFFEGLGKLRQLKILSFAESKLGRLLENPKIANDFVDALDNLSQLSIINLGRAYTDLEIDLVRRIKEKNQQKTLSIQNNTEAECDIIVKPIQDDIQTECAKLLGLPYLWSDEINDVLLKKSKTVADAIFACQLLVYMGPSDDPHRPKQLCIEDVQNKINAVCLRVLEELTNVNSNNPNILEARNQEINNLSRVVQYCYANRYLTAVDSSQLNLHMGNIQGLNKAFNAIQELQNNQKTIVQGIQSLGDIVHAHTQRIDSLHKQCQDCFEYVMKRMSDEYSHLQKDLRSTQEHLKKTLDSLHEIGQKRLMAARIKAVSGTALSAVALIPFVGACIAEGSRAIANAFSIAGALDIFDRIEILKQSIADAARDSTIEDLSDEIRKLTLGKLLTNHGIALPSNNQTIQDLAAVTLGDIADKVANGISAVADHRISDLDDSATELAGTAFGEISAVMSNHSFPNNAQTAPAILPTQQRAAAGQVTRPQAIAPAPEPAPLQRNDSAGSLDSTGSLATVDEAEDELAAAIKLFDTSDPDAVESFNRRLQKAIKAEQVQSGSTSLTTKTLPTRNSNKLRATAMDFTAHYGRPQLLKIMDAATFATIDDPKPVELQSTQKKVYDRALTDAKYHEGNYRGGKRIAPSDDQAS